MAGRQDEFPGVWPGVETGDPQDEEAFVRSQIDLSERERPPHDGVWRLFRELLRMRGGLLSAGSLEAVALGGHPNGSARGAGGARVVGVADFGEGARVEPGALRGSKDAAGRDRCQGVTGVP